MENDRQPAAAGEDLGLATSWESALRDFFISFNRSDRQWADWIAWTLAKAGYDLFYQHWDFGPGSNFMAEMQEAVIHAHQTVLVLSDAAIRSDFVRLEWTTAMSADPSGARRKLVPVRVRPLTVPLGMLGQIVYVDLVDLGRRDARNALLGAFRQPSRPSAERPATSEPPFPGSRVDDLSDKLRAVAARERKKKGADRPPAADRRALTESLGKIGVRHFNMLLEVLEVPPGMVPVMPAEQDERISALLDWAEGDRPNLDTVESLVEVLRKAPAAAVALDQLRPSELAVTAVESCGEGLEEIDELGLAYIEVQQWPKAFYTYRTLVDLAAERETRLYARGLSRLGEVHWRYGEPANALRSWNLSRAVYAGLGRDREARKEARRMALRERGLLPGLTDVPGIGVTTAKTLASAGIRDVIALERTTHGRLAAVRGFTPTRATAVLKALRTLLTSSEAAAGRTAG